MKREVRRPRTQSIVPDTKVVVTSTCSAEVSEDMAYRALEYTGSFLLSKMPRKRNTVLARIKRTSNANSMEAYMGNRITYALMYYFKRAQPE